MRALVAVGDGSVRVERREVDDPVPRADEAVVRVHATSLNRGEVSRLGQAEAGWQPGWDLAGVIEQPAADHSGPPVGTRVAGLANQGAWAERVAVSTRQLAPIPDGLSFADASTLPVAGLTAQLTLRVGDCCPGGEVLITGASGGVGRFAVQLAAREGADVTAVVGSAERGKGLDELGAKTISVGMPASGSFRTILESVGGDSLAAALTLVGPRGSIVTFGNSSGQPTTFNVSQFYGRGGARLIGFRLFDEIGPAGLTPELGSLAQLLAAGHIESEISLEADWDDADRAIAALLDRTVAGKAVLHIR